MCDHRRYPYLNQQLKMSPKMNRTFMSEAELREQLRQILDKHEGRLFGNAATTPLNTNGTNALASILDAYEQDVARATEENGDAATH
jgi:hypothetical protein